MGGRSSSRSSNQTSNQTFTSNQTETINAAITGDLDEGAAAVSGRNNTLFQANDSRSFDIRTDIDNSQRFDIETDIDNSQQFEFRTDIGDGSISGNGNAINFTEVDGGLVDAVVDLGNGVFSVAGDIVDSLLNQQTQALQSANNLAANFTQNAVALADREAVQQQLSDNSIRNIAIGVTVVGVALAGSIAFAGSR